MRFGSWAYAALLMAGVSAGPAAHAQTTIYRCTDARGEMTIQNAPCPEGSTQDKREVKDVATQPLPASVKAAPAPVRATSASDAPAATLSSKTPPPPLHLSAKPETPVVAAPSGPATMIYRCTDAHGEMTVQNAPCPAGSRTDKRAVQGVASMPLPGKAPAASAAPTSPAPADAQDAPVTANQAESTRSSAIAVPPQEEAQTLQTIGGMTLIEDPTLHKDDAAADALAGRSNTTNAAVEAPAGMVTGTAPPILFQCTTYDQGTYLTEDTNPQSRCAPLKTVGLDGNPFGGAGQACQVIHDVCARVPDQRLCSAWKKRLGETEVAARYAKPENEARNQADYLRVLRIVNDAGCVAR